MLGRWYTRKMDLKEKLGPDPNGGDCYCRKTCDEPIATCSNPDCLNSRFHLACLCLQNVSKTWLCPHCKKLSKFGRGKKGVKKNDGIANFFKEASSMETICLCKKKFNSGDKLLECHNNSC
jgi:hypothetical protein